jgi:hypothetical protein
VAWVQQAAAQQALPRRQRPSARSDPAAPSPAAAQTPCSDRQRVPERAGLAQAELAVAARTLMEAARQQQLRPRARLVPAASSRAAARTPCSDQQDVSAQQPQVAAVREEQSLQALVTAAQPRR